MVVWPYEIMEVFDRAQMLLAAEKTIQMVIGEGLDESFQSIEIFTSLTQLCYSQGTNYALSHYVTPGEPIDEMVLKDVVKESQIRWEWISAYCKDALNITLHPLGLLCTLRIIAGEPVEDDESIAKYNQMLSAAIDAHVKDMEAEMQKELDLANQTIPTDIQVEGSNLGDKDELIQEYFKLMLELGTFYRDRNMYKTDREKELHDKILAIYTQIING